MQFANTEIRAALDQIEGLPTAVSDWVVETGADSDDDDAVWVWAILPDDQVDIETRIAVRDRVFDYIRDRSDTPVWVYVSFRTVSEMEDLK